MFSLDGIFRYKTRYSSVSRVLRPSQGQAAAWLLISANVSRFGEYVFLLISNIVRKMCIPCLKNISSPTMHYFYCASRLQLLLYHHNLNINLLFTFSWVFSTFSVPIQKALLCILPVHGGRIKFYLKCFVCYRKKEEGKVIPVNRIA